MQKTSEILWQDLQHQVLFQIIDNLRSDGASAIVAQQLYAYMDSHFTLEEAYMRELAFPGYAEHLAAHDLFRRELSSMIEDFPDDQFQREAISTYLRQWLKLHVLGIDKLLETFILAADRK